MERNHDAAGRSLTSQTLAYHPRAKPKVLAGQSISISFVTSSHYETFLLLGSFARLK